MKKLLKSLALLLPAGGFLLVAALNSQPAMRTYELFRAKNYKAFLGEKGHVLPGTLPFLLKRAGAGSVVFYDDKYHHDGRLLLATFMIEGAPTVMLVSEPIPSDWKNWVRVRPAYFYDYAVQNILDDRRIVQNVLRPTRIETEKFVNSFAVTGFRESTKIGSVYRSCRGEGGVTEVWSGVPEGIEHFRSSKGGAEYVVEDLYGYWMHFPVNFEKIIAAPHTDRILSKFTEEYRQRAHTLPCMPETVDLRIAGLGIQLGMSKALVLHKLEALGLTLTRGEPLHPPLEAMIGEFTRFPGLAGRITLEFKEKDNTPILNSFSYAQQYASAQERDAEAKRLYEEYSKVYGPPLAESKEKIGLWSAQWGDKLDAAWASATVSFPEESVGGLNASETLVIQVSLGY
jgi:hypothetical protein